MQSSPVHGLSEPSRPRCTHCGCLSLCFGLVDFTILGDIQASLTPQEQGMVLCRQERASYIWGIPAEGTRANGVGLEAVRHERIFELDTGTHGLLLAASAALGQGPSRRLVPSNRRREKRAASACFRLWFRASPGDVVCGLVSTTIYILQFKDLPGTAARRQAGGGRTYRCSIPCQCKASATWMSSQQCIMQVRFLATVTACGVLIKVQARLHDIKLNPVVEPTLPSLQP